MEILEKGRYHLALEALSKVTVNHLFALAVVEQVVDGVIYTDDPDVPATFYILHPYGMSLLTGDCRNEAFNSELISYILNENHERRQVEWMQVFPGAWKTVLKDRLGDQLLTKMGAGQQANPDAIRVEEFTRVNFRFNPSKYQQFKISYPVSDFEIVRTGGEEFENMPGTVVARYFWRDTPHFIHDGIGFSLIYNGKPACTAFSAFIREGQLELGIETAQPFRGKGFALACCAALIDYCLEKGYEPVWSCRHENTGSFLLAQKLGFEPLLFTPFYRMGL